MTRFRIHEDEFEVVGFGPAHEAGYHYECWEILPGGSRGEMLGRIIVPSVDGPDHPMLELNRPVPIGVLGAWMKFVPESDLSGP